MKKLLSLILSIVIILSMSVPAFAAEDASQLTDAEIYNRIIALKSEFPDGMSRAADVSALYEHSCKEKYSFTDFPWLYVAGGGCYGFAIRVLDRVFPGVVPFSYDWNAPWYSWDNVKVGDAICFEGHAAVVLTKDANGVTVVEGADSGLVRWGYRYSKDRLMKDNNVTSVITCRPFSGTGTTSRILVNGVEKHAEGYCFYGYNHFKLRDLAMILSGTSAEFDVRWDGDTNTIEIVRGAAYTVVGGECKQSQDQVLAYGNVTFVNPYMRMAESAVVINGNNFYQLRSVANLLGTFDVDWDGATNTIIINTK